MQDSKSSRITFVLNSSLILIFAFLVHAQYIDNDFRSWKSLFISFKNDLKGQKEWLNSEYFPETYKDKNTFNPFKIIFPLSFESLPEIIRKGVAQFTWISEEFMLNLSMFNKRVIALNSLLENVKLTVTANPVLSQKLYEKIADGLKNDKVSYDDLKEISKYNF